MSPTTTTIRRAAESERSGAFGSPTRRWLAILLAAVSVTAAFWIFNRDIDWEARRREARSLGLLAENNGNYLEAKGHYEAALENHPYDWETHYSLANLLNHHINDYAGALRHYLYALAYTTRPNLPSDVSEDIAVLRLLLAGELENPFDAIEDMHAAVEAGAAGAFRRRLAPRLRDDYLSYWRAWSRRGRGTITFCSIRSEYNGFYDAALEMDFPDGTTMSVHLYCPVRDIWRLELSFP